MTALSGCQDLQPAAHMDFAGSATLSQTAGQGQEKPDERLRFATAEMDARGVIFVRYDGDPERAYAFEPTDPAYADQIKFAQGLEPGERKRLYSPRGDYLNSADGSYRLEGDGSYEIVTRVHISDGVNELAYRSITQHDAIYPCLTEVLQPSDAPATYQERPFFNFLRERIDACLNARAKPDTNPE